MKRAATLKMTEREVLEAELRRLRATLETIRDHTAVEAASTNHPVSASFLAFISGKAREALEES